MTARDRRLAWEGCVNVRDLGGLPTADGRTTRWGAVVRSDGLDRLEPAGWTALEAYGVRTIVDLRNGIERQAEPYTSPLPVVVAEVEDDADRQFIERWRPFSTPHYYRAALDRWPGRIAGAVAAVARAPAGGVLVHCGLGRDRTGLIVMLLLALAGVTPGCIADDHQLSGECLPPVDVDRLLAGASSVNARTREQFEADCARENERRAAASDRDALVATLESFDVERYLLANGLTADDLAALSARLVEDGQRRA